MRVVSREPQGVGRFTPGEPGSGYYNDLRVVARAQQTPDGALAALARWSSEPERANPVSVAQLGIGAWQLRDVGKEWLDVARGAGAWLEDRLDDAGLIAYQTPMRHTYVVDAPWSSAMAQGEAASLFVRMWLVDRHEAALEAARRAVTPLVDERDGLCVQTPAGPVLQEYPTTPPAHVLNGWIFALWGLYDVMQVSTTEAGVATAFRRGIVALASRLPLYETPRAWSRYDLFPHHLTHVASPFYHRLHVAQLRALERLVPDQEIFRSTADRWEASSRDRLATGVAIARKAAFRAAVPRRRPARRVR